MEQKFVLIYTGFNQRAVVALLRSLKGLPIQPLLIARDTNDSILLSEYKKYVVHIRESLDLNLEELFEIVNLYKKTGSERFILAPSSEALNHFFLANREAIESSGIILPLVKSDLYMQITNKYTFGEICTSAGVLVPKEMDRSNVTLPCVAKPLKYTMYEDKTRAEPKILMNEDHLSRLEKSGRIGDYYFQEYIDGKSFYLLYYFSKNGHVVSYSQRNLLQQPRGKSIVAAKSASLHNQEISKQFESLFKSLGFQGLVMVELMKKNGKFYMIEANPRMWGPSQLFVDGGVNFFHHLLLDYGFIDSSHLKKKSREKKALYLWWGGILNSLKNQGELKYFLKEEDFAKQLKRLIQNSIYNRKDTRKIFNSQFK